jgi:hypothetical protein
MRLAMALSARRLPAQNDGYVVAARADIITPPTGPKGPKGEKGKQLDTATNSLTIGRENENSGIYGKVGVVNGKALERMYGVVDGIHKAEGYGAIAQIASLLAVYPDDGNCGPA